MFEPQYQLAVQVKSDRSVDFDWLVQWENDLAAQLAPSADVDCHDFGSGEFNIFILTSDPTASFRKVQEFVAIHPLPNTMAAAYRQIDSDEYIVLWPPYSAGFSIA
jgi:hypothetical protein